jgi:hypothetical protein
MRRSISTILAIGWLLIAGTVSAAERGCDDCDRSAPQCDDADRCQRLCCPPSGAPLIRTQAAALAPLSPSEEAQCADIAIQRVFKEILAGDRFTVLTQEPVERRSGAGFVRTCKVELFDYTKNAALQATIELSTSRVVSSRYLKDVQPAIGQGEIAMARSFAETEGRERLSPILLRPLEQLEINGMLRTDGERCRYHRCVELNYYETGADAGTTPAAEPPNTTVTWRPIKPVARVIVDLTGISVVALEVF